MALEFLILFGAGLVLLAKGSDFFVESATKLAKILGVSDFVIGLTIVSLGTSLPENVTSLLAALSGQPGLSIGTIIGSNIANIALILSIAALVAGTIKLEKRVQEKIVFIMLAATILFFYFSFDSKISRFEGFVLLSLFVAYIAFLLGFARRFEIFFHYEKYLEQFFDVARFSVFNLRTYIEIMKAGVNPHTYRQLVEMPLNSFKKRFGEFLERGERREAKEVFAASFFRTFSIQLLMLAISGAGVIFGAKMMVDGAVGVANFFGVSDAVIGLFMVAIGTSLPELSVGITSARKGFTGILVGNLVGANVSNILLVIGLTSFVAPIVFPLASVVLPMAFMLFIAVMLYFVIISGYDLNRLFASIFLLVYAVFLYFVLLGFAG